LPEGSRIERVDPWAETTDDDTISGRSGLSSPKDLLDSDSDSDSDWWFVACMDWPRDRWIGYVQGYWKAATVIVESVASTGCGQDYLVYPFLTCIGVGVQRAFFNVLMGFGAGGSCLAVGGEFWRQA
jgi:hypothetical protein